MQSLNDDIDDLFRRAGENYPLKPEGADWNLMMEKLQQADAMPAKEKRKKDYKFLLLLLLLPLGFLLGEYVGTNKTVKKLQSHKDTSSLSTTSTVIYKPEVGKMKYLTTKVIGASDQQKKVKGNAPALVTEEVESSPNVILQPVERTPRTVINSTLSKEAYKSSINVKGKDEHSALSLTDASATELKDERNNENVSEKTRLPPQPLSNNSNPDVTTNVTTIDTSHASAFNEQKNLSLEQAASKEKTDSKEISKKARLYYSLIIGPDLSTVRFKKISNIGYSAGMMLGYHVTGRLSVQTGILLNKKIYFSDGADFDATGLKLPSHSTILNAQGDCLMFELPVNIRYAFITKKNHSWFVSSGVSGYLMKKENYGILYKRYNLEYVKDYTYKNSSENWFSVANISGGFQKSLGESSLTVEPYIKLPLRGVGVGKVPITSTGVYVSFSRTIR